MQTVDNFVYNGDKKTNDIENNMSFIKENYHRKVTFIKELKVYYVSYETVYL